MLTSRDVRRDPLRRGMTLIELLITLVLLAIVGGTLTTVLLRQQRFHAAAVALRSSRESLREVSAILPADLRGVSAVGGDLYELGANALKFRAQTGSAIVCSGTGTSTVVIPPTSLASQAGLTSWISMPQAGDSVFVLDEGATESTEDDTWRRYRITADLATGTCPASTGFTANATEAATGYTLKLSSALPATSPVGSAMRFYRTAEYRLYAEKNGWYLGYTDCPNGACRTMQPVSGPFPGPLDPEGAGLKFVYLDSLGNVTAVSKDISRIQFTVRARSGTAVSSAGFTDSKQRDSLTVTVAFRNRQ